MKRLFVPILFGKKLANKYLHIAQLPCHRNSMVLNIKHPQDRKIRAPRLKVRN